MNARVGLLESVEIGPAAATVKTPIVTPQIVAIAILDIEEALPVSPNYSCFRINAALGNEKRS
jgi:hypothetical protein